MDNMHWSVLDSVYSYAEKMLQIETEISASEQQRRQFQKSCSIAFGWRLFKKVFEFLKL